MIVSSGRHQQLVIRIIAGVKHLSKHPRILQFGVYCLERQCVQVAMMQDRTSIKHFTSLPELI
jgi:hypothetical protein